MSAHKGKTTVAPQTGVVVGDGKHPRRYPAHFKAGGLGVVILLVVALGAYLLIHHDSKPASKTSGTQAASQPKTADALLLTKGDASAQAILDKQAAAAKTNQAKGALYEQKAGIAYNAKDYEASLQFAQKAEGLNPTPGSAEAIGDAASALGNKSLAVQYYKLQLKRLQPIQNQDTANRIQAKITALEASS